MDLLTIMLLAVAALSLLVAASARSKASSAIEQIEAMKREALMKEEGEELEPQLEGLRKLVAMMAAGKPVDADMVKENRLFRNVTAVVLKAEFDKGAKPYVIDVRTDQEYSGGHIPGALHIPVDRIEKRLHEIARDGRCIYLTCAGGGRSAAAAEYLSSRGYLNVFNLEGGMNAWRGEVVRGA